MTSQPIDRHQLANAIRALSMDAVQRANSGHPGMPMGMADIAEVLYNDHLRHNPGNPQWWDRDRFVVSNGHGSMLLYSVLHLTGYDLSINDIKNFRQLHSPTAGHPEFGEAPGIETTTGPLGQGLANAVGMALAEQLLAARYNRDGHTVVDHRTFAFAGDGCLMEGISHEVCSLAGTWGLGKLVVFYDDNSISIDGDTEGWFTDHTPERFRAYGWQVVESVDGHDSEQVDSAINSALSNHTQPTLICCKTTIGFGSPNKAGTAATHGAPLGDEEIAATREVLDWNHPPFEIPDDIRQAWDAHERGAAMEREWQERWTSYQAAFPKEAEELARRLKGDLPEGFDTMLAEAIETSQADDSKVATRKASGMAIEALASNLPEMVGGSADLTGSNNTDWSGSVDIMDDRAGGNYLSFGVREFGMTAIANGIHLHGGFIAYTGTFLVFSDYARNAVRMSALIPTGVVHVYTHDSIGLGEDGPTHQPVEHAASLRLIPNLQVWRPADKTETMVAWGHAVKQRSAPTALILTRQGLPHQPRDSKQIADIERGGYILKEAGGGNPKAVIIATGSEVSLAVEAATELEKAGTPTRVVSMPNPGLFRSQDATYRQAVLPTELTARVAVEAGVSDYWYGFVGDSGRVIGMDQYGASAPAGDLFREYGFTVEAVVDAVNGVVGA